MNYQKRLFCSIMFTLIMLSIVFGVMAFMTSLKESRYPNIIETMPNLK